MWRANVARDERLIGELAAEREAQLAQLDKRAAGGGDLRLVAVARVEIYGRKSVTARKLPYQHLSVRVPWHDTGWEGSVCADPLANGSCLRLGRIAEGRDDAEEVRQAGRSVGRASRSRVAAAAVQPGASRVHVPA